VGAGPVIADVDAAAQLDLDQVWRETAVQGDVIRGVVMGLDGTIRRLVAEVERLRREQLPAAATEDVWQGHRRDDCCEPGVDCPHPPVC